MGDALGSGEFEGSEHGSLLYSTGDPATPTSHLSSPCEAPTMMGDLSHETVVPSTDPKTPNEMAVPSEDIVSESNNKHQFSHILKQAHRTSKDLIHEAATSLEESKLLPSGIADYCLLIGDSNVQ